jgi:hypothetical protein
MTWVMAERKLSGSKQPRDKADPRRSANTPRPSGEPQTARAKRPELPADSAIPPDKLNATNDK